MTLTTIIQLYVATAEPAGSQAVARASGLGISPASIRHTMSELEARGYEVALFSMTDARVLATKTLPSSSTATPS